MGTQTIARITELLQGKSFVGAAFWVVTIPDDIDTLVDICWRQELATFWRQFAGGLRDEEIYGLYTNAKQAHDAAWMLLDERRNKKSGYQM